MPTIIDSLVVQLGLDASKFKSDAALVQGIINTVSRDAVKRSKEIEDSEEKAQKAIQKRLKESADARKKWSQELNKFRLEIASLITTMATGYGIQQFVKNLTAADASTGRLAARLGMSTRELATWQEAAKRTGGSAEGISNVFDTITKDFHTFAQGGPSNLIPLLKQLKVDWSDASGNLLPLTKILEDVGEATKNMSPQAANTYLAPLGGGPGEIALIQKGREGQRAARAEAEKAGVPNDNDVANAIKFEQNWLGIEQRLRNLGRRIFNDFAPSIDELVTRFIKWYDSSKDVIDQKVDKYVNDTIKLVTWLYEEVEKIVVSMTAWWTVNGEWLKATISNELTQIISGVSAFAKAADAAAQAVGGWTTAIEILFGVWLGLKFLGVLARVNQMAGLLKFVIPGLSILALPLALKGDTPGDTSPGSDDGEAWKKKSEEQKRRDIEQYNRSHPDNPIESFGEMLQRMWRNMMAPGRLGAYPLGGASDERKAGVRDKLARDLGISADAASGIVSNLNAESGIAGINEVNPAVPGSRGGFGWAQWTGSRRLDFEAYARSRNLDPSGDDANYGFLINELTNKYPQVLSQLKRGGISATEAADIVARGYIIPPEDKIPGHVGGASGIAKLASAYGNITPAARYAANNDNRRSSTNSSETHIGTINVVTQAKDADGIAKSIGDRLQQYAILAPANRGLA